MSNNENRSTRFDEVVNTYSNERTGHESDRPSGGRHALVRPQGQGLPHRSRSWPAATTSTNSTTNNKTKGD